MPLVPILRCLTSPNATLYQKQAHGFTGLFLSYAGVPLLGIGVLAVFGRGLLSTPARHVL